MEGAHRELSAGLTDALGGDDADGLVLIDQPAAGQIPAVAGGAKAACGLAGQGRAGVNAVYAGLDDAISGVFVDLIAALDDDLPGFGVSHIGRWTAAEDALAEGLEEALLQRLPDPDAGGRAAVVLGDDHVLRDIDEAAGEVAAIGGAQGGVGQPLAGTVGGDEVLQHREPLAERRTDGELDNAAGGVTHEAPHSGHLGDLADVALGTADGHEVHTTVFAEPILDDVLDAVCGLPPDGHRLVVPLLVGDEPQVVLLIDLGDVSIGLSQELLLLSGDFEVVHGDGDAGLGGVLEAQILHVIDHIGGVDAVQPMATLGHELLHRLLVHEVVAEAEFFREDLVEDDTAGGSFDQLAVSPWHRGRE